MARIVNFGSSFSGGDDTPKQIVFRYNMTETVQCPLHGEIFAQKSIGYDPNLDTALLFIENEMNHLEGKSFLETIIGKDVNLSKLEDMDIHTRLLKNNQYGPQYQTYLNDLSKIKDDQIKRGVVENVPREELAERRFYL